jgi:hypothetical protein
LRKAIDDEVENAYYWMVDPIYKGE